MQVVIAIYLFHCLIVSITSKRIRNKGKIATSLLQNKVAFRIADFESIYYKTALLSKATSFALITKSSQL